MSEQEPTGVFAIMAEIDKKKKTEATTPLIGSAELTEAVKRFSEDPGDATFRAFLEVLGRVIDRIRTFVYLTMDDVAKASCGEDFTIETMPTQSGEMVIVGTAADDGNRLDGQGKMGMSMYLANIIDRVLADERKPGIVFDPWSDGGLTIPRSMLEQMFAEGE